LSAIDLTPTQPPVAPGAGSGDPGKESALGRYLVAFAFLGPALAILGVWIVYPVVATVKRSFYDRSGGKFIGLDNYHSLFTTPSIRTAIENNAIWVAVVPALVTAIGLVFAVLTERVSWAVAFKTAVFMPMAVSLFAAGVIWHVMDQKDPNQGAVNALVGAVHDSIWPPGSLSDASPSGTRVVGTPSTGISLKTPVKPGQTALLALTAIPPTQVPKGALQAVTPPARAGEITGTVWRDFKPGGGVQGKVEKGELGLPGVTVKLRAADGSTAGSISTDDHGAFTFSGLKAGEYRASIGQETFRRPFGGVSWLGSQLITPAVMIAYIWVWAGFAMVVIGAGLASISREVLEAARTDGSTEWQVFRRVTVPMLAPVLSVVFITMLINVLKVFDIILAVAPGSTQSDANVIALAMWRTSFGGVNDFGLGSAIAVFLFLLVIPILALNVRRFRREV
jgi:alpha-glucoside transport system permease protein